VPARLDRLTSPCVAMPTAREKQSAPRILFLLRAGLVLALLLDVNLNVFGGPVLGLHADVFALFNGREGHGRHLLLALLAADLLELGGAGDLEDFLLGGGGGCRALLGSLMYLDF